MGEFKNTFLAIFAIIAIVCVLFALVSILNKPVDDIVKPEVIVDTVTVNVPVYIKVPAKPITITKWDTVVIVKTDTTYLYLTPNFIAEKDTLLNDSLYRCNLGIKYSYPDNMFDIRALFDLKSIETTIIKTPEVPKVTYWWLMAYQKALNQKDSDCVEVNVGVDLYRKYKVFLNGSSTNRIGIGLGSNF